MRIKIILSIIWSCLYLSAFSQIQSIEFNQYQYQIFKPQIKIAEDNLFLTTPSGVYYKSLSDITSNENVWKYLLGGIAVNDIIINGNNILASADKFYTSGNVFLLSVDSGKNFENFTPEEFSKYFLPDEKYVDLYSNRQTVYKLDYSSSNNKLVAWDSYGIYQSADFGKTWNKISDTHALPPLSIKYNPHNDNMIIFGFESEEESLDNAYFILSSDNGKSWNYIPKSFYDATSIAFHSTNSDLIVLAGGNVVKSSDGGITWEEMHTSDYENDYIDYLSFDTRGSDRLYGTSKGKGMMYSDDFGKTWEEYYSIPTDNSKIADFEQYGSKLYILMSDYTLYELDLELIDSAVEEVTEDSLYLTICANALQFSSDSEIARVEIYRADGMLLHSVENNAKAGNIDISALSEGVHIAVFTTSDGHTISKKIINAVSIN